MKNIFIILFLSLLIISCNKDNNTKTTNDNNNDIKSDNKDNRQLLSDIDENFHLYTIPGFQIKKTDNQEATLEAYNKIEDISISVYKYPNSKNNNKEYITEFKKILNNNYKVINEKETNITYESSFKNGNNTYNEVCIVNSSNNKDIYTICANSTKANNEKLLESIEDFSIIEK